MVAFIPCSNNEYSGKKIAIIGYGISGQSCVKFLLSKGAKVDVFDQSINSKDVALLLEDTKQTALSFYQISPSLNLRKYAYVVVSPGVNLSQAYLQDYIKHAGAEQVIGDIELFSREIAWRKQNKNDNSKIVAITGSNGKSTVVDMLAKSIQATGLKVGLGGNFGIGALSLLDEDVDVFVLELSSFQLESTHSLVPDLACILNVSSDHLDRHGSLEQYAKAKQGVYQHAKQALYNEDESLSIPAAVNEISNVVSFSSAPATSPKAIWQLRDTGIHKAQALILSHTQLSTLNYVQKINAMVCLACMDMLGLAFDKAYLALLNYQGLAHRFETVLEQDSITWVNDSKATNPGASIVAINSLKKKVTHLVLIAGGDAKGADTSQLMHLINEDVDHLVLLGKDANLFMQAGISFSLATSMRDAVIEAKSICDKHKIDAPQSASAVLLSPACASIDMFTNYQERGEQFRVAVLEQVAA